MPINSYRLLLEPSSGDGGGGGGGGSTATAVTDPTAGFAAALKKHGDDAAAMARTVYVDNEALRRRVTELTGSVPADGSVVLAPDRAAAWKDLLARDPKDILRAFDDLEAANVKLAEHARRELVGLAAAAYGYDADVLATLVTADLKIELADGKDKAGKPMKIAEVVSTAVDGKGAEVETRTPLDKYAESKWAKFLPSLKSGASPTPAAPNRFGIGTPASRPSPRAAPLRDPNNMPGRLPDQRRSRI